MAASSSSYSGRVLKESVYPYKSWKLGAKLGAGACGEVFAATLHSPEGNGASDNGLWVAKVAQLPPAKIGNGKAKKSEAEKAANALYGEHTLYRGHLHQFKYAPSLPEHGGFGNCDGLRFLIMQRMRIDLEQLRRGSAAAALGPASASGGGGGAACKGRGRSISRAAETAPAVAAAEAGAGGGLASLPLARVCALGKLVLEALRCLHTERSYAFVDMKPENIMLGPRRHSGADRGDGDGSSSGGGGSNGLGGSSAGGSSSCDSGSSRGGGGGGSLAGDDGDSVYLVDFALAKRFVDSAGRHVAFVAGGQQCDGTPEYMSLSCHSGGSAGRRDDIEALGYILMHLVAGRLPWSGASTPGESLRLKQQTPIDALCPEAPALARFVAAARATPYEAAPDYAAFDAILAAAGAASGGSAGAGKNAALLGAKTQRGGGGCGSDDSGGRAKAAASNAVGRKAAAGKAAAGNAAVGETAAGKAAAGNAAAGMAHQSAPASAAAAAMAAAAATGGKVATALTAKAAAVKAASVQGSTAAGKRRRKKEARPPPPSDTAPAPVAAAAPDWAPAAKRGRRAAATTSNGKKPVEEEDGDGRDESPPQRRYPVRSSRGK